MSDENIMNFENVDVDTAAKKATGLTIKQAKRRLERIAAMTDIKKARSAHRRLSKAALESIAAGTGGNPRKLAALVVGSTSTAGAAEPTVEG